MHEVNEYFLRAAVLGIGATAFMDAIALVRKRWFAVSTADYGLVGRWLGYFTHGKFQHDAIAAATPIRGERFIGWSAHYVIGIAFAFVLLVFAGRDWTCAPTLLPALVVGLGSVAAPFLLMQPGMGAGVAASRTSNPRASRIRSLTTHAIFGLGLFAAGRALAAIAAFSCEM